MLDSPRLTPISLDGTWEFIPDPTSVYRIENLPNGQPINVPASWESQLANRYGIVRGWYRRKLAIPASWAGQAIVVRFGAVMYRADVWLDGAAVGSHEGGFTPFEVDLTAQAMPGHVHDLVVLVVNPLNALTEYPPLPMDEVLYAKDRMGRLPLSEVPHGKQTWYTSLSGIWQSVSVEALPGMAITSLAIRADDPDGRVEVAWRLRNPSGPVKVELRITDETDREVARARQQMDAGLSEGRLIVTVPNARPWAPESPTLYCLQLTATGNNGAAYQRRARFGFRRVEARDGSILLNGRPLFLRGALDQDLYPEGLSFSGDRKALYMEQFRRAREMGLNLVRCHIKVPDPAYLDAADEVGVLLWCELPNWTQFTSHAATVGRETLASMVETMGHHPSIIIWTIINEDWGTRLRDEGRDRRWLLATYEWLKQRDPTRLVVDNSACDSPTGRPNFHVSTDIADFHAYFSMPDKAIRWRNLVIDFANRPPWLWSPHGDSRQRGDEPLVMSEFGNWGLPDITEDDDPWWFATGRQLYQPRGALARFSHFGLTRIWPNWTEMARATQERQFEALQYEIGELRRHDAIKGYVITELTDAYWEANGLLDLDRRPKSFHPRLPEINGADTIIVDLERRDVWGGDILEAEVLASSFGENAEPPVTLSWALHLGGSEGPTGKESIAGWPANGPASLGRLHITLPAVSATTRASLEVKALDAQGETRASSSWSLAIVPAARRQTARARRIAVDDPLGIWGLEERVTGLGHRVVPLEDAEVLITTELRMAGRQYADSGGAVLVLVRSRSALPAEIELEREVVIHPRWLAEADGATDPRNPWRGDWISAFSWILPGRYEDLPETNPLDFAYQQVIPDHVLRGYHPQRHAEEVAAGMFVGWVHAPAALLWSFRQGTGRITITTFKLSPECSPVATVMLEELILRVDRPAAIPSIVFSVGAR